MMNRPNLDQIPRDVREYIEYLENQLEDLDRPEVKTKKASESTSTFLTTEKPTRIQLVSISNLGQGKRTPRHFYERQHRGGMGIFDLDVNPPEFPAILTSAEDTHTLLLFTSRARVFRYVLSRLDEAPIRSRGNDLLVRLPLDPDESLVAVLPERASGNVALASASGGIRCLRHHLFGEHMRPGTAMYNFGEFGPLTQVSWTNGNSDLLLVSRLGMAIRFSEKLVPPAGGQGIRLSPGDQLVGVTPVTDDSLVFLAGSDGRGTLRMMSSFAPNKSMGGIGKIAMKNPKIIGAITVETSDDIFMISKLGKLIRFQVDEVPTTEGAIQGVNCMALRSDEVTAVTRGMPFLP